MTKYTMKLNDVTTTLVTLLWLSHDNVRYSLCFQPTPSFGMGIKNNAQRPATPPSWATTVTTSLRVTVGLGPGEEATEEQQQQKESEIVYEEPDHELYRQSRMTKLDHQCDAWYTALLESDASGLGNVSREILDQIRTPVELKDEIQLQPSDPRYTAYVRKLRQPGAPIVPAYGCENYAVPVVRRKAEAWRHFDVLGLVSTDYSRLPAHHGTVWDMDDATTRAHRTMLERQRTWLNDDECAARLVYVNGRFVPSLSLVTDMVKDLSREDVQQLEDTDHDDPILNRLRRLPDGFTDRLVGDEEGLLQECGHLHLSELSAPHHNTGNPTSQFAINNQQGMAAFAALNTVQAGSVALVDVPKGHKEDKPILIVQAITNDGGAQPTTGSDDEDPKGVAMHPRTLVIINEESEVSLIQTSVDLDHEQHDEQHESTTPFLPKLYNGYTQVFLQANATLYHSYLEETGGTPTPYVDLEHDARVQEASRPSLRDSYLECLDVHLADDRAAYHSTLMGLGGRGRAKIALSATLLRPDTHCRMNGLSLAGGDQTVDMRTTLHHVSHGTSSEQTQKNMVSGRATATFKGRIRVEQSAQQTESDQLARTLLLSDRARMWAIPSLEIIADDVSCTHGATISDLSEEELFYLRSRGIDRKTARNIMMYAFVDSVGQEIDERYLYGEGKLKDRIVKRLENMVPRGDRAIQGEFHSV